ncbi:uncharacterized protein CLUP02_13606 [Colletotrichum lupini]|uniref:Uncharacterized protein n=1 Tax=Colletotrichum lupini TaxID=145971 RepID=A0A9Q8T2N1_9PEZI|nr:uncharacterized protein CLUP02_13606 [Colletotrichum lupini]UQC88084.1 hypothetical protein CLUP02_13606 [Colletotrichum lupini]
MSYLQGTLIPMKKVKTFGGGKKQTNIGMYAAKGISDPFPMERFIRGFCPAKRQEKLEWAGMFLYDPSMCWQADGYERGDRKVWEVEEESRVCQANAPASRTPTRTPAAPGPPAVWRLPPGVRCCNVTKTLLGRSHVILVGYAATDMQCSKAKKAGLFEMGWSVERAREEIMKDANMEELRETAPYSLASLQRDGFAGLLIYLELRNSEGGNANRQIMVRYLSLINKKSKYAALPKQRRVETCKMKERRRERFVFVSNTMPSCRKSTCGLPFLDS